MTLKTTVSGLGAFFLLGVIALSAIWLAGETRNDIVVKNASQDKVSGVVLGVTSGESFPVTLEDGVGSVAFRAKNDASIYLEFARNGVSERTDDVGYVTHNLGSDYRFIIRAEGVDVIYE